MKKILVFFSVITFFISCKQKECEDEEGCLTPEEQSWLPYAGGEVLFFKSNDSLVDTFNVGNKKTVSNFGYHESADPCYRHQQQISLSISDITSNWSLDLSVGHKNKWHEGWSRISIRNAVLSFADFTPQNNILINGTSFNGVYIMNIDTTNTTSRAVWKIYYSKENGILRYDETQGHYWEKIN